MQIMTLRIGEAWVVIRDDGNDALAAHEHGQAFTWAVIAKYASVDESEQGVGRHEGCSRVFYVDVAGSVRSQAKGPSAKADWLSVDTMGQRNANGQSWPKE
ncbi:hypothetical protein GCM10011408_01310 [Dyella caseinilytica]|nr:hypothetical protein GCM10011408_01310 [Dyella caseinilytica]